MIAKSRVRAVEKILRRASQELETLRDLEWNDALADAAMHDARVARFHIELALRKVRAAMIQAERNRTK